MPYQFTTPTIQVGYAGPVPAGGSGLFRRMKMAVGQTVLKKDGFYSLVLNPSGEDIDAADEVYLGGYTHVVDDVEAAALTAAGYGAYLVDVATLPTPPVDPPSGDTDPPEFGLGDFGSGLYGS